MDITQIVWFFTVHCILFGESQEKGTPFGEIKGPKSKNDRILIVGAGAAGIHMGYKLKELGFKHVTIFESSGRIGGKSKTVYHRFVPHEMGTVYTQPDYVEIFNLIEKFDAGKILDMPSPTIWIKLLGKDIPITNSENAFRIVMEVKGITDPIQAALYFNDAARRYILLHRELFGTYEGELMPRPSAAVLQNITMSFLDFLKRHDMEVLKSFFTSAHTVQGYGHLDEVPALYGLMWLTPRFVMGLNSTRPGEKISKILSKGFQTLWEEIAKQSDLDIKLDHEVKYIYRQQIGSKWRAVVLYHEMKCRDEYKYKIFDFIITTPSVKDMIEKGMINVNMREFSLFTKTTPIYFTTTLVDTKNGNPVATPQSYFVGKLEEKIENTLWGSRDSNASIHNITGDEYASSFLTDEIKTSVFYQYAKTKHTPVSLWRQLDSEITTVLNMTVVGKPIAQEIWSYFPRYSQEDIERGILWDIFDRQGNFNTWYIGSSVCFESVKSVVEYNLLLLRHYDVPAN